MTSISTGAPFCIGNVAIRNGGDHVFIIAEAGVNHNGDLQLAKRLIRVAAEAGADAVKFQMFDPDEITTSDGAKAAYQKEYVGDFQSQRQMLRSLALKDSDFAELSRFAHDARIEFLVTPFDARSARFLLSLGVAAIKIGSGEITNLPFLRAVAELHVPVILSTGMSTLGEVEEALRIFQSAGSPTALLHCVSSYPTPSQEVNLRAMDTMLSAFGVPVGFSDHTAGQEIAFAAAARGAAIIEKHFTVDRNLPGPDQKASLEPSELRQLVQGVRRITAALGTGYKMRQLCEEDAAKVSRRSIVLLKAKRAGERIALEDLAIRRPGFGIAPKYLEMVVGRRMGKAVATDTVLTWDLLE